MSGTAIVSLVDFLPAPRYDSTPWNRARIEEAAASSGAWSTLATVTLSPLDADPSQPVERSFTVSNATAVTGYWYRVTFLDASGAIGESSTPFYNGAADVFASVDELEARLGIELTPDEEQRALVLLTLATGAIRAQVKQNVTLISGDVWVTRGNYGNRLRLPQRPGVAVSSVTASFMGGTPVTIDPTTYYLDRDELVRYDWPLSFTVGNGWLGPGWKLTVTYDHGLDPLAQPLPYRIGVCKTVALEVATRAWVNPEAAASNTIGGIATAYPAVGVTLTAAEKEALNDAFRRDSGTVGLR